MRPTLIFICVVLIIGLQTTYLLRAFPRPSEDKGLAKALYAVQSQLKSLDTYKTDSAGETDDLIPSASTLCVVWTMSPEGYLEDEWIYNTLLSGVSRPKKFIVDPNLERGALCADTLLIVAVVREESMKKMLDIVATRGVQRLTVLHLADEFCSDYTGYVKDERVTRVYRNHHCGLKYSADLIWLPIGVSRGYGLGASPVVPASERTHLCGFAGSNDGGNRNDFAFWATKPASKCYFRSTAEFHGRDGLGKKTFRALTEDTVFVFCPPGMSVELFRYWEALEAGAIPVIPDRTHLLEEIPGSHPLPVVKNWDTDLDKLLEVYENDPQAVAVLQHRVQTWWRKVKWNFVQEIGSYLSLDVVDSETARQHKQSVKNVAAVSSALLKRATAEGSVDGDKQKRPTGSVTVLKPIGGGGW